MPDDVKIRRPLWIAENGEIMCPKCAGYSLSAAISAQPRETVLMTTTGIYTLITRQTVQMWADTVGSDPALDCEKCGALPEV